MTRQHLFQPWAVSIVLVGLFSLLIFLFAPDIDLPIAGLYYVPGESFPARFGSDYHLAIRKLVKIAAFVASVSILAALIWRVLLGRASFGLSRQVVLYFLLALALGPGLLTNSILKEYWGRARPSQIIEFDGDKTYTRPLLIADQCETNCSFVSGDASVGFIFVALGFAARRRVWKLAGFGFGFGLGGLFGFTRIAQGGHFFSDIFFAAVFMTAVAWLLHYLVVEKDYLSALLARLPDRAG